MHRLLISLIACVWVSVPVVSGAAIERRIALVIGNSAYKNAPLRNPVNDATDMAAALRNLGFSVTLKTDAHQRTMEESIRVFGNKLQSGGVGLFYYAGHGLQYRGTNYLIPVHAEINSEADVKYESVDAGRVLAQMERAGNNLNVIILDACRNNPFARSFRSAEQGLVKMDAPTGSILAYATAPGSVAADGTGRNGLYTEKLLRHMQTPGMDLPHLFMHVRKDVVAATNRQQVPWESSSLIGDFFFVPSRGVTVTKKEPVEEPPFAASVSPKVFTPQIVESDGSFEKLSSGIVYDRKTELEWYVGPDEDTNWHTAHKWAKNLDVEGGGWRLPTKRELRSIHRPNTGIRNMSPLLRTTGWLVWTSNSENWRGWTHSIYNFEGHGGGINMYNETASGIRAFAVRKRK